MSTETTSAPPTYPADGSFDWYWYAGNGCLGIGVLIGSIITIMHTINVFMDLFTKGRASIPGQKKPKKSWTYILTAWCILFSLYGFLINMIWAGLSLLITTNDHALFCRIMTLNATNSYQFAKMLMYLVFIIRLYAVYNDTSYRYNSKLLLFICIFIVAVSLVLMTLITLNAEVKEDVHEDPATEHIVGCTANWPVPVLGMIVLFDLSMSLFSMSAFIHPLRKVMKGLAKDKGLGNLMRIGQRHAILTSCAAITTLWLMLMAAIGYLLGSPIDLLTNMICLMLTTAYYDNNKYYRRICYLPIKCSNTCCGCCCGSDIQRTDEKEKVIKQGMELQITVGSKTNGSNDTPLTPPSSSPANLPRPSGTMGSIDDIESSNTKSNTPEAQSHLASQLSSTQVTIDTVTGNQSS